MFYTPGIPIGYEPKLRLNAPPTSAPQRREKGHDDLIKFLPAFADELVVRKTFEKALARMIRTIAVLI